VTWPRFETGASKIQVTAVTSSATLLDSDVYKTLIRPVLAYGSDTWVLSKSDEAVLGVFERKILRAIFGPTNVNGEWRIKYNNELYTYYTRKLI